MPDPVDDLTRELSVLRDGPVLALPGAAAARRRGDQRSRRRRTGLAAAALVLGAVALPIAWTLTSPRDERLDVLAPAPALQLEEGLLGPQDLAQLEPGTWKVAPADSALPVLPAGCDAPAPTDGPDVELRALVGPRRAYVRQHLVRFDTEQQAVAALTSLRATLSRCADGPRTTRLLSDLPGTSDTRFYAERVGATGSVPVAVERVGPVLSAVLLGAQRVTGPVADAAALPPLADAAARALDRVLGGSAPD